LRQATRHGVDETAYGADQSAAEEQAW
jgi:hypothetical protein